MQQLRWKNFPVKIEKSLCKLCSPKYIQNPVHNSVTIYSAKALPAFWCVKGASPPRRRGGLRGRLPQPRWGCFPLPGGRLSNRAKAARRAALGGGGSAAGESFYPWRFVVIFGKMFGNRWKTIPASEKLFKKKQNFLLKKRACCAIFICGKAIY